MNKTYRYITSYIPYTGISKFLSTNTWNSDFRILFSVPFILKPQNRYQGFKKKFKSSDRPLTRIILNNFYKKKKKSISTFFKRNFT